MKRESQLRDTTNTEDILDRLATVLDVNQDVHVQSDFLRLVAVELRTLRAKVLVQ
jgi:hypothetical protein